MTGGNGVALSLICIYDTPTFLMTVTFCNHCSSLLLHPLLSAVKTPTMLSGLISLVLMTDMSWHWLKDL